MNSAKAKLFIAIQNRIGSIVDTNNNPVFRLIDRDYGQLENYVPNTGALPPVSFPCALIKIDNFDYSELGNNGQQGKGNVQIRIGFPPFSGTSSITPELSRNQALQYFELEQLLYKSLHGWTPGIVEITPLIPAAPEADPPTDEITATTADLSDIYGSLIRIKDYEEQRQDFIIVIVNVFSLGMEDYSASIDTAYTPRPPFTFTEDGSFIS